VLTKPSSEKYRPQITIYKLYFPAANYTIHLIRHQASLMYGKKECDKTSTPGQPALNTLPCLLQYTKNHIASDSTVLQCKTPVLLLLILKAFEG